MQTVEPHRLTDKRATGAYRTALQGPAPGMAIPRADLATALLDTVRDDSLVRRAVQVSG